MKLTTPFLCLAIALCFNSCSRSSGAPPPPRAADQYYIARAQANRMIQSYLTSIGYPQKQDEIRSWEIDAPALRNYLANTSIKKIQVFMAHTMDYINSGHEGQRPGPGDIVITPIIVGTDEDGQFVYTPDDRVMDNAALCPKMCRIVDELLD